MCTDELGVPGITERVPASPHPPNAFVGANLVFAREQSPAIRRFMPISPPHHRRPELVEESLILAPGANACPSTLASFDSTEVHALADNEHGNPTTITTSPASGPTPDPHLNVDVRLAIRYLLKLRVSNIEAATKAEPCPRDILMIGK